MMRTKLALLFAPLLACSAAATDDVGDVGSDVSKTKTATLSFASDWSVTQTGALQAGTKVKVAYGAGRTQCTGTMNGQPAYTVTADWRLGGPASSFVALGHSPNGPLDPTFTIPSVVYGAGSPSNDLEVWFENGNMWGCHEWDANYGKNYHFKVGVPATAPDWMGNAWVVLSRATCNGVVCPGDGQSLGQSFVYDSWVLQRAIIRQVSFEIYEPGVTDWNDPDTWKKLDVRLYSRVGDKTAFTSRYIDLSEHVGNNARYTLDLASLEPFSPNPISKKTDCPTFTTQNVGNGMLQADVQFYFQVNGVQLRPTDGTVFHGAYQGYEANYKICGL